MPFVQLIPTNRGGGGQRRPAGARFGKDGQFSINHNAAKLLGEPETILVYAAAPTDGRPPAPALRIRPAIPTDRGSWLLTGGGLTQHSIKLITLSKNRPELIGNYSGTLHPDGLHLVQLDISGNPQPIDTTQLTWRQILPSTNQRRNHPSQIIAPARLTATGQLILAGKPVEQLGTPDHLLIFADTAAKQLRIEPGIEADPHAWRLSGAGVVQRRVSMNAFTKANPDMIGEYTVGAAARGLLLRQKS